MRNQESEFIRKMDNAGVMPIFYHPDESVCLKLLETAYEGGIRVIELVNRGDRATLVFSALKRLAESLPGLSLGVGTIYHPWQAEEFIDMGAEFIVAPVMNAKLGDYCRKVDVPWVPGCGTVTEVFQATELGAELVKIYPANILGPDFVPAIHAVLPKVEIIPTGGVEPNLGSIKPWFDAGVLCVGMGSQLMRKDWISQGEYSKISESVSSVIKWIQQIKNSQ